MRLYLIRHGLTLPEGSDSHEWPLSPEGEEQAEMLADAPFWKNISTIYSSPEDKTLATVRPTSRKHGIEVVEDDRLREARRPPVWYDDYDGAVREYFEGSKDSPEGWEDAPEVVDRVSGCVSEISRLYPRENIAVCGHGLMFTLYLASLSPDSDVFDLWSSIGFGEVAVYEDGNLVSSFGDPVGVV